MTQKLITLLGLCLMLVVLSNQEAKADPTCEECYQAAADYCGSDQSCLNGYWSFCDATYCQGGGGSNCIAYGGICGADWPCCEGNGTCTYNNAAGEYLCM